MDSKKIAMLILIFAIICAAAFMITGPATKITNLGALKVVLGIKHFLFYWAFIIIYSCVAGILINIIL